MITQHQKHIRRLFGLSVAALVLIIVSGSLLFGRNNFLTRGVDSITLEAKTVLYRWQFNRERALADASMSSLDTAVVQAASGDATALPVLLYHGIVRTPDQYSMTAETFKDQMFALKKAGYHTVTLAQAYDFLTGKAPLPAQSILITFDDGRNDSYRGADPILKAIGYRAVMFVATEDSLTAASSAGDTYYIDADDIQTMIDSGRWEIGSHAIQETGGFVPIDANGTKGNFLSSFAWNEKTGSLETPAAYQDRVTRELQASKQVLESTFHISVTAFAYPFGDWGQQSANNPDAVATIRPIIERNYAMAFRQVWQASDEATLNYPHDDLLQLKRIEVATDWNGEQLVSFLQHVTPKSIPFHTTISKGDGWRSTWGSIEMTKNGMTLAATPTTTGADVFLEGSKGWDDYIFWIDGTWKQGTALTIMARYQDGGNYAACTFEHGTVRAEEVVDGKKTTLGIKTLDKEIQLQNKEQLFGIRTYHNEMQCLVNRQAVPIAYTLTRELSLGGIGVKIWDQAPGNSTLGIRSVHVVPAGAARVPQ